MTTTAQTAETAREPDWELFDQVRRLTVKAPSGYGYVPPVIGYWDRHGRTRCLDCAPENLERDGMGYPHPIDAGNSAVIDADTCDFCAASLMAGALERFGSTR